MQYSWLRTKREEIEENMKKALITATIWSFYNFEKNDIKILQKKGYQVYCATNFKIETNREVEVENVVKYQIDFSRSPISRDNLHAYYELKKLIADNKFDLIHCHTPVAAFLTRIAVRKMRNTGTRVIYTSHGYHFYKGGNLKNWLIFYPLEKLASRFTDTIITINKEDLSLTENKFYTKDVFRVPGVGIDLSRFSLTGFDRNKYRIELGLKDSDILIVSVGEVNANKNHCLVIKAIAEMNRSDIHYFVAGRGNQITSNEILAKSLGIENQVHFLGYRTDIPQLDAAADIFAFPSIREGLGLAAIEALACGTPVVGMDTRGINEYCIDNETGFLFKNIPSSCAIAIEKCIDLIAMDKELPKKCKSKAKLYRKEETEKIMKNIYSV